MRKLYKRLTEEQKNKGVIFSSQLMPNGALHEVFKKQEDKDITIDRLMNDRFFNKSPYKYNEIRR